MQTYTNLLAAFYSPSLSPEIESDVPIGEGAVVNMGVGVLLVKLHSVITEAIGVLTWSDDMASKTMMMITHLEPMKKRLHETRVDFNGIAGTSRLPEPAHTTTAHNQLKFVEAVLDKYDQVAKDTSILLTKTVLKDRCVMAGA
jgi:hypothetical protein